MPLYQTGSQSNLPQSVLDYLAHSHSEGERNKKLFPAAQQCHWAKLEQNVTVITLLPRAKQDGLGESEIRETIASAYRQEAREPARGVSGGKGSSTRTAPSPYQSSSNGEWPDPVELPVPPPGLDLGVLMRTLFGSDGISIGAGLSIIDGKLNITGGIVKSWDKWQTFPSGLASLNKRFGLFFRVNPMRHGTDPVNRDKINIYFTIASQAEIVLQWIIDGLGKCEQIAREMGLSVGRVSQIATQLIKAGKVRKKGREYVPI
jgi:hypothetical protein